MKHPEITAIRASSPHIGLVSAFLRSGCEMVMVAMPPSLISTASPVSCDMAVPFSLIR
jgi:hypothetical protein